MAIGAFARLEVRDRDQRPFIHEQHHLLREGYPVTWRDTKCADFLGGTMENVRDNW